MKFLFITLLISRFVSAEVTGQGEVAFESRFFDNDGSDRTQDIGYGMFSRVEASYKEGVSNHSLRAFARVDKKDNGRDLFVVEDLNASWYLGENEQYSVLFGYKLFNWTATEAFHPADVINSRNLDSDLERLEKKGELTAEFDFLLDDGTISFYYFPRFEEPIYPSSKSRLGASIVPDDPEVIDSGNIEGSNWIPQFGVRLAQTHEGTDFSLHALYHVDRNKPLIGTKDYFVLAGNVLPNNSSKFTSSPTPYYFKVFQLGGTFQKSFESILIKFEGAHRAYQGKTPILTFNGLRNPSDHTEAAISSEYTFNWEGGFDTTFIAEATSIFGVDKEERAELSVFQRDFLFAIRHVFNDVMGKEIFLSLVSDMERDNERFYNFSYSQRLTDTWKIKTGIRVYDAPQKESIAKGLEVLDNDNSINFTLSRFF
ncbi:hypothetical protein OAT67_08855 [Bacteriovoracaceae bacterium]|nr:hypothetical protein [Bacteriovoracaceae bacterium]